MSAGTVRPPGRGLRGVRAATVVVALRCAARADDAVALVGAVLDAVQATARLFGNW